MECKLLTQEEINKFKESQKRENDIFVEIVKDGEENEIIKISSPDHLFGEWCILDEKSLIPKIKKQ